MSATCGCEFDGHPWGDSAPCVAEPTCKRDRCADCHDDRCCVSCDAEDASASDELREMCMSCLIEQAVAAVESREDR